MAYICCACWLSQCCILVTCVCNNLILFLCVGFSNASDALDKLRFLSVTEPSLLGEAGELEIRIKPDPENGTITITYAYLLLWLLCYFVFRGYV